MTASDDPIARALAALDQFAGADLDPVAAAAWQTAREAVVEAQSERGHLMTVAREGQALLAILDGYDAALEAGEPRLIAELAEAVETAEQALEEALSRISFPTDAEAPPPGEAMLLAMLDRLGTDEDEEGDEDAPRRPVKPS